MTQPLIRLMNTETLYRLKDENALYVGAMNLAETHFYPFFAIESGYDPHFQFVTPEKTEMLTQFATDFWPEEDHIIDIHDEFSANQKQNPYSVTNVDLYNLIHKILKIRDYRHVRWMGRDENHGETGIVMKIDNEEMHVLWNDHNGAKLPLFDYAVSDPNVVPFSY